MIEEWLRGFGPEFIEELNESAAREKRLRAEYEALNREALRTLMQRRDSNDIEAGSGQEDEGDVRTSRRLRGENPVFEQGLQPERRSRPSVDEEAGPVVLGDAAVEQNNEEHLDEGEPAINIQHDNEEDDVMEQHQHDEKEDMVIDEQPVENEIDVGSSLDVDMPEVVNLPNSEESAGLESQDQQVYTQAEIESAVPMDLHENTDMVPVTDESLAEPVIVDTISTAEEVEEATNEETISQPQPVPAEPWPIVRLHHIPLVSQEALANLATSLASNTDAMNIERLEHAHVLLSRTIFEWCQKVLMWTSTQMETNSDEMRRGTLIVDDETQKLDLIQVDNWIWLFIP